MQQLNQYRPITDDVIDIFHHLENTSQQGWVHCNNQCSPAHFHFRGMVQTPAVHNRAAEQVGKKIFYLVFINKSMWPTFHLDIKEPFYLYKYTIWCLL